ncbi:MAG TPA: hypothetical protein VFF33_12400 [Ignavibacteriaceae bacterium]|nr:hypothetical protein [Ignavibacteriaceae bacterium]
MSREEENMLYQVPEQWRKGSVISFYPSVKRSANELGFDIYDFQMLFKDKETLDLIRSGRTVGCFYIESPGMRSLLRRLEVDTFEMLTAASSIIRPGVAESGMMQEFIARHKDPSRRTYLVPEMEKLLGDTYGVMVYQEDVIKITHHIAGLSLEEADLLRRAMSGKMRSHKAMQELYDKFINSCLKKGMKKDISEELWRQIESFAGYSFCKAHSASFALLSFQVAYLKAHYPAEFMASVLSNGGGFYSAGVYIWECRRLGIKIKLPCINKSKYEYVGNGNEIRVGLMAIKNLSSSSIDRIIEAREENGPYVSLADFLIRTRLGFEETCMLIKCGAMGCLKKTRITLLKLMDIYFKRRRILDESYNDLFMSEAFEMEMEVETNKNYSVEEICKMEYEAFDYMVTRHPLHFFSNYINDKKITKAKDMYKLTGQRVKMIGWYMASKRIRTKKGDIMKFLSLEDLTGTFEAVIFPKVYDRVVEKTMSMGPYILEGYIDVNDYRNLVVDNLDILTSVDVKESIQKDSVDHNYYGDVEKITLEEFSIVKKLGKEELKKAYSKIA